MLRANHSLGFALPKITTLRFSSLCITPLLLTLPHSSERAADCCLGLCSGYSLDDTEDMSVQEVTKVSACACAFFACFSYLTFRSILLA